MFGSGILLALANLIPGVSGGTIAVVCKIYDKLLAVFSLDFKKIKTEWKSYLFLILGMFIGIFGLSYLIKYLLDNFPLQSNFFFLGIILGSIPMISRKAFERVSPVSITLCVVFFLLLAVPQVLSFFDIQILDGGGFNINLTSPWYLFICGFVAALAMIIPGISGSFVLVLLGVYDLIITAITERNFLFLLAPAVGIALGCVTGARLIGWLLKRYSRETYGAILGLVAGSGVVLCEGFGFTPAGIGALIVMVIAVCIAFLFTRKE